MPINKSEIEKKIEEFFEQDEQNLKSLFNQIFAHICLTEFGKTDIYYLSKIVTFDQLKKISQYYNGDTIKTPTEEEANECVFLTICYFLREELGWDWQRIKTYLNVQNDEYFSSVSLGKKILNVKESMKKDLKYMLSQINREELYELLLEARSWTPKI